jgi:hypothetical protein
MISGIIILVAIVYLLARKIKEAEIVGGDMSIILPHIDYLMRFRGWQTKVDPYKGKITVTKDSIISTDIYLIPQPDGRIEVLHGANTGVMGWVLIIILIFIGFFIGVIAALILHLYSRKFAKEEVIPTIVSNPYGAAPPPHTIPFHSQIYPCSSCGKPLKFVKEHNRWYCYNCKKYV